MTSKLPVLVDSSRASPARQMGSPVQAAPHAAICHWEAAVEQRCRAGGHQKPLGEVRTFLYMGMGQNLLIMWYKPYCRIMMNDVGMDQYLLIPFLGGWTSIYQLFWCSRGVQVFDALPYIEIGVAHSFLCLFLWWWYLFFFQAPLVFVVTLVLAYFSLLHLLPSAVGRQFCIRWYGHWGLPEAFQFARHNLRHPLDLTSN